MRLMRDLDIVLHELPVQLIALNQMYAVADNDIKLERKPCKTELDYLQTRQHVSNVCV